jgi:hypothetical protein
VIRSGPGADRLWMVRCARARRMTKSVTRFSGSDLLVTDRNWSETRRIRYAGVQSNQSVAPVSAHHQRGALVCDRASARF